MIRAHVTDTEQAEFGLQILFIIIIPFLVE